MQVVIINIVMYVDKITVNLMKIKSLTTIIEKSRNKLGWVGCPAFHKFQGLAFPEAHSRASYAFNSAQILKKNICETSELLSYASSSTV